MTRYVEFLETGKSALASGDSRAARLAFAAAASIRIGDAVSRALLAEACLADGDKAESRNALDELLLLRPGNIDVLSRLGKLELELRNTQRGTELTQAAAAALKRQMSDRITALFSFPGEIFSAFLGRLSGEWPDTRTARLCRKAEAALADWRLPAAAGFLRHAEQRAPDHPKVLCLRAQFLRKSGHRDLALESLKRAGEVSPGDTAIELATILMLAQANFGKEARRRFDALPTTVKQARDGRLVDAHTDRANGRIESARDIFGELLDTGSGDGEIAQAFAFAQATLGNFEAARDGFILAARLSPRMGQAYWSATISRCVAKDDDLFQGAQRLCRDTEASQLDRGLAEMTIGRALIGADECAHGFALLKRGNALIEVEYDPEEHEARTDSLIKAFSPALYRDREQSDRGMGRIFIVGLPRCGSTLVEQILSSHPLVFGAGEMHTFPQLVNELHHRHRFPEDVAAIDQGELGRIAEEYITSVQSQAGSETFVTDKNLYNLHYLGLIALVFPKARVVHCRRNIMDNGYSIYAHRFFADFPYSNDLHNIGHHYGQYRRLMRHWIETLPIPVYQIDYERLVEDQEVETRKLLDAVGLTFDDACLRFHENERIVATSSVAQVRERMNRGSIDVWRKFEAELEPLQKAVAEAGREAE